MSTSNTTPKKDSFDTLVDAIQVRIDQELTRSKGLSEGLRLSMKSVFEHSGIWDFSVPRNQILHEDGSLIMTVSTASDRGFSSGIADPTDHLDLVPASGGGYDDLADK